MDLLPIVLTLSLVVMGNVEAGLHREPRQATQTTTLTVATTTTVGMYPICASLVNASRPCIGRRAVWSPNIADIKPTSVYSMEATPAPKMEGLNEENRYFGSMFNLISSLRSPVSSPMEWLAAQTVGVKSNLRGFTTSFYNTFLGLTSTETMYITQTRISTEYSTITDNYKYFLITSCIPPNLNYPICPSDLAKEMAI